MGVRRQPPAFGEFRSEVLQVALVQPAFQEGTRIDAGSGVALKIHEIAREFFRATAEEMVECDLVQCRARGVGGNMAAQPVVPSIGIHHHGHGVPADVALDAHFRFPIAGERRLLRGRDGVEVGCADGNRRRHARGPQSLGDPAQKQRRALRSLLFQGHFEQGLDRSQHFLLIVATGRFRGPRWRPGRLFFILMLHLIAQIDSIVYSFGVLCEILNRRLTRQYGQPDDSQS